MKKIILIASAVGILMLTGCVDKKDFKPEGSVVGTKIEAPAEEWKNFFISSDGNIIYTFKPSELNIKLHSGVFRSDFRDSGDYAILNLSSECNNTVTVINAFRYYKKENKTEQLDAHNKVYEVKPNTPFNEVQKLLCK